MTVRALLICLLFASSALAQFQAQNGWGLPRRVAQTSLTQGLVLDAARNRVIVAEQNGIVAKNLEGEGENLLFEQQGVRNLVGAGGGDGLALAWYSRSLTEESAVWAWFQGKARKLAETSFTEVAVSLVDGQPLVFYTVSEEDRSVLYAQPWNAAKVAVRTTTLNIGALGVGVTARGRIGVVFAEGYRNAQDEKYDAIFATGTLKDGFEARRVGAAVYVGREQRYGVAVKGEQLLPLWWFETDDEQRTAAFTKRHFPRFALWDGRTVREFDRPGRIVAQLENAVYYTVETDVRALDLETLQVSKQLITPETPTQLASSVDSGVRRIAWQSLQADGFASSVWLADTTTPYQPSFVDHISVTMGWNPWYPGQSMLAQTLLAVLVAAGAVMLIAPLVWLAAHQFRFGVGVAIGIGALFVVGSRLWSGTVNAPGWSLEALLTPPWWTVPLGLALSAVALWLARKRLTRTELGPTIASSLVVLIGVFVMVFSKAGFIRF
jgi:hypothetical protein